MIELPYTEFVKGLSIIMLIGVTGSLLIWIVGITIGSIRGAKK